jgi:rhodanese-related sulfurtransferase
MTMVWIISGLLLAVVAGWYLYEGVWDRRLFRSAPGNLIQNLYPPQARELLERDPTVQVVDVRAIREFQGGAIPRARNVPMGDPAFRNRLLTLDLTKPVLVYCAGGYRSRKAVAVLRDLGFKSIHHLHRGYMSWQMAGFPTERNP